MLNGGTVWGEKKKRNATISAKCNYAPFKCAGKGHDIAYECNIFRLFSIYLSTRV